MAGGHRSRSRHRRKTSRKRDDSDEEERNDDDDDEEHEEEEERNSSRKMRKRGRRKSSLKKIDNISHLNDTTTRWLKPSSLVVGGKPASQGQFPFQVALTFYRKNGSVARGGGSIITASWILTAAHLCVDVVKGEVAAGAYPTPRTAQQNVFVEVVVIQNAFRTESRVGPFIVNDIALLHLNKPLKFTDLVKPIKLPTRADENNDFANRMAILVGWGKTSQDDMRPFSGSSVLNFAYEKILSNEKAAQMLAVSSLPSQLICAIGEDGNACSCNGDSGGPLVVKGDRGTLKLVGIVSHRVGACGGPLPHLLTRVTSYLEWIGRITSLSFQDRSSRKKKNGDDKISRHVFS